MTWPRVDGMRTLELGTPGDMRVRLNSLVGTVEITGVNVTPFAEVSWERAGTPVDDGTRVVCLAFRLVDAPQDTPPTSTSK
ncbi:hypothetical protein QD712_09365 [Streptomyces acidiscabies]|uniref:hypothetical protein n=1 Tax=Streptomyces acidiscabies TaxID=42234 RepID=UPI0030D5AA0D